MNLLRKTALALGFALSGISVAQAAPLTSSSEKTILFVTESVTQGGSVNISAETGPLTTSELGFSIRKLGSQAAPGASPAALPAIVLSGSYGTSTGLPTRGQVLDLANNRIKMSFPSLKASLSEYMARYGISSGWFNFKQEVRIDVNGAAETWTIYWDYFADQKGRGAYADARLISPDPKALYVIYTPKAVDKDLPAGWAYAGAGTIKYQLRDVIKFQPVTEFVTVDVGGAFDTVQGDTEVHDAGIRCLMDNANSGCPTTSTDVKRLMDQTGAILTVVDYIRRVEPVWEEQPDGSVTPKMSAEITKRELIYAGCTNPTYRNVGNFGYTLSATLGRYLATSSGSPRVVNYTQIQEYHGTYLSPTVEYDWSLKVPRRQSSKLNPIAIDPVKGNALMNTSDIPGLIGTSPISIVGDPTPTLGTFKSGLYHYGGWADDHYIEYKAICGLDGVEIDTSFWKRYAKGGGDWSSSTKKTVIPENTWTHIALNDHSTTRFLGYTDPDSQLFRIQDNAGTTCYPYACHDGYGESHNANAMTSMDNALFATAGPKTGYGYSVPMQQWDCGTASAEYYLQSEGNSVLHNQQICYGIPYLKGWWLNGGGTIVQVEEKGRIDPPSYYNCVLSTPDSTGTTGADTTSTEPKLYCYDLPDTGGGG